MVELPMMESAEVPEIDVEEASGVLELPITGWVIHPRLDSVRIIGFINRGTDDEPRREPTIILHAPTSGFLKSLIRAVQAWRKAYGVIH